MNSCFRDTRSKVESYIDMVHDVLEENDSGILHDIVIDTPPVKATDGLIELYKDLVASKREVEWFEVRSSSEDYILQVHDFITGSAGDLVEEITDKATLYDKIEGKRKIK